MSALMAGMFLITLGDGSLVLDSSNYLFILFTGTPGALAVAGVLGHVLGGAKRGAAATCAIAIALVGWGYSMREPSCPKTSNSVNKTQEIVSIDEDVEKDAAADNATMDIVSNSTEDPIVATSQEPSYENDLWPTTNSALLAVPESERWYNAREHMGTTCTIVGPVVDVYQAKDEQGMPIFVDIGEKYPSSGNVTLVIWASDLDPFLDMLNAVDGGGAWLSVTGYLNNYNRMPQFNSGLSSISFTWWTGVK